MPFQERKMATSAEIEAEAREILRASHEVREGYSIPVPEDIPYGAVAKKFRASVLSIDIRNSSGLLSLGDLHAGKVHKAFLRVCALAVRRFDGEIRSFNGDGLLAMWKANQKAELTNPVRAAMGIKWMVAEQLRDVFHKYNFDFGIGLSLGDITSLRAGVQRIDGGNDLLFLDESINKSVVIAKQARAPNHVECTEHFYNNLLDEARIGADRNNMWRDGVTKWKNGDFRTRLTSYYWKF